MNSKHLIFIVTFACLLNTPIWCQNQTNEAWKKHRHHIQAHYGSCDDVIFIQGYKVNTEALGLSYSFDLAKYFYAAVHWQKTSLPVLMREKYYSGNIEVSNIPSPTNPVELPFVPLLNSDREIEDKDIRTASIVRLTSSNGFYRMSQYHFNLGCQIAFQKHRLRAGLGLSYFQWQYRDILTRVKITSGAYSNETYLSHLVLKGVSMVGYNGSLSYDFALTRSFSVGLNTLIMFDNNFEQRTSTLNLSIGFTPQF